MFKLQIGQNKDLKRRFKIIEYCGIDTLLDIGANAGQYSKKMRQWGFNKRIISFEPLNDAFAVLKKYADKDEHMSVHNCALGAENVKSVINISGNSYSSSILSILPSHVQSAPKSAYIAQQEIEVKKLDDIFNSIVPKGSRVMMKVDTQGYEKNVIDGAVESLNRITVVQLEMSIVPLYENGMLWMEMVQLMESKGFQLFSLENGHYNRNSGQLLQVDGIFVNKNHIEQ